MKITTFDPVVVTGDSEATIELFEALGFEKTHHPIPAIFRMKDANGYHIDVVNNKEFSQDKMYIRMNVDNFDEAYEILSEHGFTSNTEVEMRDSAAHRGAIMDSPSGFTIVLMQHIKKES